MLCAATGMLLQLLLHPQQHTTCVTFCKDTLAGIGQLHEKNIVSVLRFVLFVMQLEI